MKLILATLVLIPQLFSSCDAYKILVVFPLYGKSHSILGDAYVRRLLAAGHEVTYIAGIPSKENSTKLRQIEIKSNANFLGDAFSNIDNFLKKKTDVSFNIGLLTIMMLVANNTLMHEDVQRLLHDPSEQFDVVVVEWLFSEIYAGLSSVFNCPYIWSSSMDPHGFVLSLIDEDPNPAYVPDIFSAALPPFTFRQRLTELWYSIRKQYIHWQMSSEIENIYEKSFTSAVAKRGRTLPPLEEMKYNASLMLGNSHISVGQPIKLPQNYKPIAGYHMKDTIEPLPKDLQKIMDSAKHGVIYFSMGSMLQSKSLPESIKTGLFKILGELQQTVIWKFEEVPKNLPKNIHVVSFAPQQSILAHPNCILFITHGGLLSTTETVRHGVPIIGIPVFADQFLNVNRAVHKGFAKQINLDYDVAVNLKVAIVEMLENPRYRERAKELSLVYHDRPVSPGKELVHWVEHVVKTRGAPHLRSPALMTPWYQKMYLDLIGLFVLEIVILSLVVRLFLSHKKVDVKRKFS